MHLSSLDWTIMAVAFVIYLAIGFFVGRNAGNQYAQNVQRCEAIPSRTPQYWDVTYEFRGTEHRAQLSSEPGRTITVIRDGVPRM